MNIVKIEDTMNIVKYSPRKAFEMTLDWSINTLKQIFMAGSFKNNYTHN